MEHSSINKHIRTTLHKNTNTVEYQTPRFNIRPAHHKVSLAVIITFIYTTQQQGDDKAGFICGPKHSVRFVQI